MPRTQRRWDEEFKDIIQFWDFSFNELLPNKTSFNRKSHWKCVKNHKWIASAFDMTQRNWGGCPICNNRSFVNGQRNFSISYPDLMVDWDFTKNKDINPTLTNPHSGKKVWWKCKNGHNWEASINGRTKGFGCPYCAGNKPSPENNLSLYPIVKEFDLSKNGELRPENIMPKSSKKVWWTCEKGHEFYAAINDRVCHGSGCPKCHKPFSLFEIRVYSEILSVFPSTIWSADIDGVQVDVLIKELNIGIEVDGHYWHKDKVDKDKNKNVFLMKNNITLIRLRESPLHLLSPLDVGYSYRRDDGEQIASIKKVLKNISSLSGKDVSAYLSRNSYANTSLYSKLVSEVSNPNRSLSHAAPELISQWHPLKNGKIRPDHVSFGSQQTVWWICNKGHEWEAVINSRVKGHGCPQCSGRYSSKENNLRVVNNILSSEWDYNKNKPLMPEYVTPFSNKKVWWTCKKCGHKWIALISSRSSGRGCPNCHENNRSKISKSAINNNLK